MSITTHDLYMEILQQVMLLERHRYQLSQSLLHIKNHVRRRQLILSFLTLDLKKHQLFAYVAQTAVQVGDLTVINRLRNFYRHGTNSENIVMIIQDEINNTQKFINVIQKSLHSWVDMSFAEKRLTKEIEKYILARANINKRK